MQKVRQLSGMANGFPYLAGNRWQNITRDERYFCAELYQQLKQPEHLKAFLALINEGMRTRTDIANSASPLNTDPEAWEVGYEVVMYRDVVHVLGNEIDGKQTYGIGASGFSRKRTFDLCLFSADRLVIIEAKVCEGLDGKQLDEFEADRDNAARLLANDTPEVLMVGLWSKRYQEKLNTRKGKNFDGINARVKGIFDSVIHWSDLTDTIEPPANLYGVDLWDLADASIDRKPGRLPLLDKGKITWSPSLLRSS